ncbi:MAG: hypothetical protein DRH56_09850, partial [Deltaproteobacteria bacterium]
MKKLIAAVSFAILMTSAPALAVPIQALPGLTEIHTFFYDLPNHFLLELTLDELNSHPNASIPMGDIYGRTVYGGLSDSDGDLAGGDEYFILSLAARTKGAYWLDSVSLYFDGPHEYPIAVTALGGVEFYPGYGPEDISKTFGPPSGNAVGIIEGSIVFKFASSAQSSQPVPEPLA